MSPVSTLPVTLLLVLCAHAAAAGAPPLAEVRAGAFDVLVVEQAELAARQSVTIASDLPSNTAKIAWLVADGAFVEPGDPVVRFDAEPFRDEAGKAERDHQDARAALLQADAELQILVRRAEEQHLTLQHQIEIARLELEHFREADRPLRLAGAENEMLAAQAALELVRQEAETQRNLTAEGFGSPSLLAQAEGAEREKRDAVALKSQQVSLLREVILPSEERRGTLELARKERELEAARQANMHILAKQRAVIMGLANRVEASAAAVERAKARLDRIEIRAPVAGFVIHVPTSVGNAFRKVQVGDSVWHRHGFVVIPDMSELVGEVLVREIDVGKLAPGQPVTLHPEAYPDITLQARVETVGTLAHQTDAGQGNEFQVRIAVAGVDPRLRPGMRARAEILTRHFEDVLRVPVEAVFRDRGESLCFTWDGRRSERRPVELGDSDGADVVVLQGLRAGDRVLLSHPGELLTRHAPST